MCEARLYLLHLTLCSTWLPSQPTSSQLSIMPFVVQDLYVVWLQLFSWHIVWLEQGHSCPGRVHPGPSTSGTPDKRDLSSCVWKGVRMERNIFKKNNHYILSNLQKQREFKAERDERRRMTKGVRAGHQETESCLKKNWIQWLINMQQRE